MQLTLTFDLGEGAGVVTLQIEDLEPDRVTDDARVLVRQLLTTVIEHHLTQGDPDGAP